MAEARTTSIVVLVAEDETIIRDLASDILEDAGYRVYEARDGEEALTVLESRGETVSALVSDITMPNLNGVDLATIVDRRWPHIAIVMTSAYPPHGFRGDLPNGALFLSKPYTPKALAEAVEGALRQNAKAGSSVALHSIATMQVGKMHGAGGLAQPIQEPEKD